MVFYDAPTAPSGIFDDFLNISVLSNNASTRSFKDHVASFGGGFQSGLRWVDNGGAISRFLTIIHRTVFHSVSLLNHSQAVVDAVANETAVRRLLLFPADKLTEPLQTVLGLTFRC